MLKALGRITVSGHICALLMALSALVSVSCEKAEQPASEADTSAGDRPRSVEEELLGIMGRGWDTLSYDLNMYDTYISGKGKTQGYGPDGRYYDWQLSHEAGSLFTLNFKVDRKLRMKASGKLLPVSWILEACDTKVEARAMRRDSVKYTVENFVLRAPQGFPEDSLSSAVLNYCGNDVGYVAKERFEDENYVEGEYYVLHYYGDNRTFAINAESLY